MTTGTLTDEDGRKAQVATIIDQDTIDTIANMIRLIDSGAKWSIGLSGYARLCEAAKHAELRRDVELIRENQRANIAEIEAAVGKIRAETLTAERAAE